MTTINMDEVERELLVENAKNDDLSDTKRSNLPDTGTDLYPRTEDEKNHGVSLTWSNLNVTLKEKKNICRRTVTEPRQILQNVHGYVESGSLVAIIGSSGVGKTTLLNVLTSNVDCNVLDVTGKIMVDGVEVGAKIAKLSAYIQQDDVFIGMLTVREHLIFRARLDGSIPDNDRYDRVDEVIRELGLSVAADTRIGIPGRIAGLSGGERKRLSFASEILSHPAAMFCDEVTSGLDSFMARQVVDTLKYLSSRGITIVCTIHQPTSEVFALFDSVCMLAGGRVAYMGPTPNALDFFTKSLVYDVPSNYNPADLYLQKLSITPGNEDECHKTIEKICNIFEDSHHYKSILDKISDELTRGETEFHNEVESYKSKKRKATSWLTQLSAVLGRTLKTVYREPMHIRMRMSFEIMVSVMMGLLYLNVGRDPEQVDIQNVNGLLYITCVTLSMPVVQSAAGVIIEDVAIFYRDIGSRLYGVGILFVSMYMAYIPMYAMAALLQSTVIYWLAGLYPDVWHFLIFVGIAILLVMTAFSFGSIAAVSFRTTTSAEAFTGPISIPIMFLAGNFINNRSLPVYFEWLSYFSWNRYAYELLTVNQWKDIDNITCATESCVHSGRVVLNKLSFSEDHTAFNLCLHAALFVGYALVAFLILWNKCRKS